MTDVKVEQCDRVLGLHFIPRNSVAGQDSEGVLAGKYDDAEAIVLVARHRQAAEKATRERDAGIAEAHRQARLEAAKNALSRKVKAEARDHESMAIEALHIATAIRSQNDDR
ncbi:hypothetical protein [Sphingomonas parapaucimobilis]|nr:hypothetical protein [Sphingomonas parapaucimobilis]